MISSVALRLATRQITNKFGRMSFCFDKALLNPYKHNSMSHRGHNLFIDLYDFGEYPEIIDRTSKAARTYQPIVLTTMKELFNEVYGTNLSENDLEELSGKRFDRFVLKNLKSEDGVLRVVMGLLPRLAERIFVKESRFTWIMEQEMRLRYSVLHFQGSPAPETIGEFLEQYNEVIETTVLVSTFGESPFIKQSPTALEKHYVEEMAKSEGPEGVKELNELQGDRDNIINKMMSALHRL